VMSGCFTGRTVVSIEKKDIKTEGSISHHS